MGQTHTRIHWIETRAEAVPAMYSAWAAYLAPFGFQLDQAEAMADADVCLVMADKAQQAYTHPDFMRARQLGKPLVVLLTVASAMDRVALLDLGADDCMVHPIEQRELAARLHALRRRQQDKSQSQRNWVRFGPWVLDTERRQLSNPQISPVTLSQAEYRLLLTFLSQPFQVISGDRLMDEARGRGLDAFERSIDLLVSRLRHKLGDDPRQPSLIQTVRGQGYLFNASPNAPLSARTHTFALASGLAH